MKFDNFESNNVSQYQDIISLMKTMGLIKNKSRQGQFHNNIGEIYFE